MKEIDKWVIGASTLIISICLIGFIINGNSEILTPIGGIVFLAFIYGIGRSQD